MTGGGVAPVRVGRARRTREWPVGPADPGRRAQRTRSVLDDGRHSRLRDRQASGVFRVSDPADDAVPDPGVSGAANGGGRAGVPQGTPGGPVGVSRAERLRFLGTAVATRRARAGPR
ncbi:hypothetical protein GCM10010521_49280 [Streptomyces rameus]|uniref:Uncharacterized protein n=1 Tax=Streptomyces rameus TaxID=68261 RepID=A0ABP6NQR0_9ACTN